MNIPSRWVVPGLAALALVQLAVPASMILRREATLRTGVALRFRTAPVDPYDAFRGKFVALGIDPADAAVAGGGEVAGGQRLYAVIATDTNGFASVARLERRRPAAGDYVAVRALYGGASGRLRLQWPFDRYYMAEEDAPRAEAAYRAHSRRGAQDAFVTVRVRRGFAVLENLHVGGVPIAEYLRREQP